MLFILYLKIEFALLKFMIRNDKFALCLLHAHIKGLVKYFGKSNADALELQQSSLSHCYVI